MDEGESGWADIFNGSDAEFMALKRIPWGNSPISDMKLALDY